MASRNGEMQLKSQGANLPLTAPIFIDCFFRKISCKPKVNKIPHFCYKDVTRSVYVVIGSRQSLGFFFAPNADVLFRGVCYNNIKGDEIMATILIVEDDRNMRLLTAARLGDLYTTVCACDGVEALEYIHKGGII